MKRLRCICDNPWAFFDLSSVAVGSQSAMQQYYLPTIYIIWRWKGISLAIIRSVSLRLQNEGQKKLTDRTDAHGVFDTDFFDLCFLIYIWISYGFASVNACGCLGSDCPVICRYLVTYIAIRKASAATCKIRLKSPLSCQAQSKENQNINQKKNQKTDPWKDSVASVIIRERFLI